MEDDRVILLNNAGEPEGEEDNLNLTDPTGPFFISIINLRVSLFNTIPTRLCHGDKSYPCLLT